MLALFGRVVYILCKRDLRKKLTPWTKGDIFSATLVISVMGWFSGYTIGSLIGMACGCLVADIVIKGRS